MYNPFDKRIEDLSFDDIRSLQPKLVKEGFYIEYKSSFVRDNLKIAHSIASFANTHGGWYFVGIDSDETNLPTGFPGFDLVGEHKPIEHLRDIIKDKINPFPVYYTKLVEIGSNKVILVVQIPESDETPHITKDGKIYRRNAEGSDPVPEKDRYVLDKLYEKSAGLQSEIERFCREDVVLSEAQKDNGFLEIYLMPYPLNLLRIERFFERDFLDRLKKNMNDPTKVSFGELVQMEPRIPFNSVAASWRSIIFRQYNPGQLRFVTLTFELFNSGNAKIIIPFEFIPSDSVRDSDAWRKLIASMASEDISSFRIIDGFKTLSIFVTLLQKYFDLLKSQNWQNNILIAYRLRNTWRTILFFDSPQWIKHTEEYGTPICPRENSWIPELNKAHMIAKMPKDGMFQLTEFSEISANFGLFHHECAASITEWVAELSKKKTADMSAK